MPENKLKIKRSVRVKATEDKQKSKVVAEKKPAAESIALAVVDTTGKKIGTVSVSKKVFGADTNKKLIAQAVRVYLANQRAGSASVQTRGEVSMTTAKWYRQKGTGRARHGAKSAPIFVHGGVAHGPKQKDFSLKLPSKMKRKALFSALSARLSDDAIIVVSGMLALPAKTKEMVQVFSNLHISGSRLVVVPASSAEEVAKTVRSLRNIQDVTILPANVLNTYEVIKASKIVFLKESMETMKELFT